MKYYLRGKSLEHLILNPKKKEGQATAVHIRPPPSTSVHRRPQPSPAVPRRPPPSICTVGQYGRRMLYNVHEEPVVGGRNPLHIQTRYTDKLRNWVAELFPMDRLVESIVAMEVGEARVARKAVALGLASVDQELIVIIKTRTAIHTQTILVLLHELLAFLPLLLEVHLTAIFTAVSVVIVVVVVIRHHTGVFLFKIIFINSIVKPQRSHHSSSHSGSRSHFLRSFSCLP